MRKQNLRELQNDLAEAHFQWANDRARHASYKRQIREQMKASRLADKQLADKYVALGEAWLRQETLLKEKDDLLKTVLNKQLVDWINKIQCQPANQPK